MATMMRALTEPIIDVIYPPLCVCCRKPYQRGSDVHLCSDCYFAIERHAPPFCPRCGRSLRHLHDIRNGICSRCSDKKYPFDRAWSLCRYEGICKDLIHDFKYRQKRHYKTIFAQLLKEFLGTFKPWSTIDVIIPIPLHAVKLREREYNQSAILAGILGELLQKPLQAGCLERIRNTTPQFDLDEQKRAENIRGCFRLNNGQALRAQSILIVDDVLTTGATLSEAARTIRAGEPQAIEVLSIAS